MSLLTTEQQYDLGARIMHLVIFVGLLTQDEIETLKVLRQQLLDNNSHLAAVSGVITPMAESEHKISRQQAMVMRIDAVLQLHESNVALQDADKTYHAMKDHDKTIREMFGL